MRISCTVSYVSTGSAGSDELISAAEVARLAGVTRAAVSNWRRRHPDFPEPVGGGRNALFALSEVTDWLDRQRKSSDVSDEVLLWQSLRGLYSDNVLTGVADAAEELANGPGGRLDERSRLRMRGMAAQTSGSEVISGLIGRFTASSGWGTSVLLAQAVAQFAGPVTGTVFDPAFGVGSLMFALAIDSDVTVVGQELDASAVRIAQARAVLQDIRKVRIKAGDSLRADAWPDLQADLVVCDPPSNVTDWGREELLLDGRWEFGVATRAEGELAWLQHCYAHTAPGGSAIVVMPPSVAYRKAGRRIRAELVRRGVLTHVVALPPGMVISHALPVHLWKLTRPSPTRGPASFVRMVDLSAADPEDPFGSASGHYEAEVPLIDLLDDAVDVTPAIHVSDSGSDQAAQYVSSRDALTRHLQEMAALLPQLVPGPGSLDGAMLRITDLARANLVDVTDGTVTSVSEQLDTDYLRGFLHSATNTARSTSGSGTFRADVRGSRIPQMSIDEQRRYAAAFRALDETDAQLRRLISLSQDVITRAREGLTSGTLRPEPPVG